MPFFYLFHNCSDRFRTTVNVLGDSFGVAIVQHYSQKQLAKDSPPTGSGTTSTPSHIGEPNCTINYKLHSRREIAST